MSDKQTTAALLPCPFCGAPARLTEDNDGYAVLGCAVCPADMATGIFMGDAPVEEAGKRGPDFLAATVAHWNARVAS